MIRLLLDQGLPRSTGQHLQDTGWLVVHVGEIGMARATDHDILGYAKNNGFWCVTLDADFHSLLAHSGAIAPSVIRIRQEGLDAETLARLLRRILALVDDELRLGAAISVTDNAVRIRMLPII